jgi:F-type H+-transporting ATPase subunit epsilon
MEKKFTLEIATPYRLLLKESEVEEVSAPGYQGYFTALPMHSPYLVLLSKGVLSYRKGKTWKYLTVIDGFMEVLADHIIVLAEKGEEAELIDIERAKSAKKRAEDRLKDINNYEIDFERARAALQRAIIRLKAAESQKY